MCTHINMYTHQAEMQKGLKLDTIPHLGSGPKLSSSLMVPHLCQAVSPTGKGPVLAQYATRHLGFCDGDATGHCPLPR